MKKFWNSLRPGQKRLAIVMVVLFAIVNVAGIYGLARMYWPGATPPADQKTTADAPEKKSEAGKAKSKETINSGGYEFTLDENGMAEMPVTTDPREAAAGAAAVAFSIRFSELDREDFLDEAIARMTKPSKEYVGPYGEVHTLMKGGGPFEETEYFYKEPAEVMQAYVGDAKTVPNENLIGDVGRHGWWFLAMGGIYESFQQIPGDEWISHPEIVLSAEEMAEAVPDLEVPTWDEDADSEPDTPGATLSEWYVLSEVENSMYGNAWSQTDEWPASFGIWCDAPEDGGVCGVAHILNPEFPSVWPRQ